MPKTIEDPPISRRDAPNVHDGFGDASFLGKYRLLSKNEQNGNYILTAFLAATVPTASYSNGRRPALSRQRSRTVRDGEISMFRAPSGSVCRLAMKKTIGHGIAFNNAFQYHGFSRLWPEFEVNSTFWKGGNLDGRKQAFVTPGLIGGRFKLHGRLVMAFGAGYQIAATHFHMYNHGAPYSRYVFHFEAGHAARAVSRSA